jgi:hypothetical protein
MALRLLWPTPVGMADNNDAVRLMCQVGADATAASVRRYSHVQFAVFGYPKAAPGTQCIPYPTSEAWLLRLTGWFHVHVLGGSGAVDMREAVLGYCLLTGLVIAVGVRVLLPRLSWVAVVWALGLLLILADATFADYAASPYSETAALNGLLVFAVAASVVVGRTRGRAWAFLVAWAAALVVIMAKTETATIAVVLGIFFAVQRLDVPGLRGRRLGRVVPVMSALTLLVVAELSLTGGLVGGHRPEEFTNVANEITMTVMPNSDNADDVAVGLGLPRSFGAYSGSNVWSPHPVQHDPAFPAVADKFTQTNLGGYLAGHPVLSARVLASGSGAYTEFRNAYLGTYPAGSGHAPGAQECRVCVVTGIAHSFAWAGFAGVVASWTVCAAGALWLVRRTRAGTLARGFAVVGLILTGCAVTEYLTSVFGEGNEVTKHLAPALFAATLAPLWIVVGVLLARKSGPVPVPPMGGESEDRPDAVIPLQTSRAAAPDDATI